MFGPTPCSAEFENLRIIFFLSVGSDADKDHRTRASYRKVPMVEGTFPDQTKLQELPAVLDRPRAQAGSIIPLLDVLTYQTPSHYSIEIRRLAECCRRRNERPSRDAIPIAQLRDRNLGGGVDFVKFARIIELAQWRVLRFFPTQNIP
jgi:hypothetical protein